MTDARRPLEGRRIVLGVCGGIAAYKAVEVCRRLVDAGAHVSPVLTRGATRFVGELTFSALGSERAQTSLWDGPEAIPHTRLGQQADLVVIVPATARLLGTYAAGISNDLLTATLLATRAPVLVCPAMHTEMWEHPAVADNIATLRRRGVGIVEPATGHLAGGDVGQGRLADPADIAAAVVARLAPADPGPLAGVTALVTAGGTREPIDPVRFVGNRSSGKQGHAIAEELAARGATVHLVTTTERPVPDGVTATSVETAAEMEAAVGARADAGVIVMAAAVADFRPAAPVDVKLKKDAGVPAVTLERTPDILAGLGRDHRPGQVLVGFAAETVYHLDRDDDGTPDGADAEIRGALVELARGKLEAKGADLVVANDVAAPGAGFAHDTNAVIIVDRLGNVTEVPLAGKRQVAAAVVDAVVAYRRGVPSGATERPSADEPVDAGRPAPLR